MHGFPSFRYRRTSFRSPFSILPYTIDPSVVVTKDTEGPSTACIQMHTDKVFITR